MDAWAYTQIMKAFASLHAKLDLILEKEQAMSKELDTLTTEVTNMDTVVDSAVALINGLAAQIVALKDDPVKLQALADDLHMKSTALADAVTANTPGE